MQKASKLMYIYMHIAQKNGTGRQSDTRIYIHNITSHDTTLPYLTLPSYLLTCLLTYIHTYIHIAQPIAIGKHTFIYVLYVHVYVYVYLYTLHKRMQKGNNLFF